MGYNFISSPLIFCSLLLTQTAFAISPSYLSLTCAGTVPEANKDNFILNRNFLFDNLVKTASNSNPMFAGATADNKNIKGLALCRGDVSQKICETCLSMAKDKIANDCPVNLQAIAWYDYCYLKVSNEYFFRKVDYQNKYSEKNKDNAKHPTVFYDKVVKLLNSTSDQAAGNKFMFAEGNSQFLKWKIYAMAQCSEDIAWYCRVCLDFAVKKLPGYGRNIKIEGFPLGGMSLTGSCFVRYEIYKFSLN